MITEDKIIAPKIMINFDISKEEFFNEFFEKKIFYRKNALTQKIFEWQEIEHIIKNWNLSENRFIALKNKKNLDKNLYTEEKQEINSKRIKISQQKINDLLREGASLVLDNIDKAHNKIELVCENIAKFTESKTLANAYLAFDNNEIFDLHWDTHDVFIIQLEGEKNWEIYKPTWPLPLANQRSFGHETKNIKLLRKIKTEKNDLLYIPRGFWHKATATPGKETFHISIGIHTPKEIDYIIWIIEQKLSNNQKIRKTMHRSAEIDKEIFEEIKSEINNNQNKNDFMKLTQEILRNNDSFKYLESFIKKD